MKLLRIASVFLLCSVMLCSCGNKNTDNQAAVSDPNSPYKYNISFEDMDKDAQKFMKNNIIVDEGETLNLFDIDFKVDGVTYTRSLDDLEQNYYYIHDVGISDVGISDDNQVDDDHIIGLVQLTMTNKLDKEQDFYTNSFLLYGLEGTEFPEGMVRNDPFYMDKVVNPVPENRKYFRLTLKPEETITVTVGFLCDRDIPNTQNTYLAIGTTGSVDDPWCFVKLPEAK